MRSCSESPRFATRAACTSIFMRAMSTPVGHSRRHALQETHSRNVSAISSKVTSDGEAQRVGAPTRDVALVAGDAVARAHDAARKRAAGAVVVAHLDRTLETMAGAGIGGPVEMRANVLGAIGRGVAEEAAIVEVRRAHDLAR